MKLYSAFIMYDYEGGKLLGVFSTEEKAKAAIQKSIDDGFPGDGNEIYPIIVDTEVEIYI